MVYTLAVKEITGHHTGENLKKIILQELETVGILPQHLYTITADNGANLVKAVELNDEEQFVNMREWIEDDEDIVINDNLMEMILQASWESERITSNLFSLLVSS